MYIFCVLNVRNTIKKRFKPFEADFALLEKINSLESYGSARISCKDSHSNPIRLSPGPSGISVFQESSLVKTYDWSVVRKLSFKQKQFLIKLRRDDGSPSDVKPFSLRSRNAAKNFWKLCVETHAFFKLRTLPAPKSKEIIKTIHKIAKTI